MSVEIIPALPADAPALSDLVNTAYRGDSGREGWTTEADLIDGTRTAPDLLEAIILAPGSLILKYVDNGVILGCVELRKDNDRLYLGMLTVKPKLQGKGIGKALMQASEAEARKRQCTSIFMRVLTDRLELLNWYYKQGYTDTGHRAPFAFTDPRFGFPKKDLEFAILEKNL